MPLGTELILVILGGVLGLIGVFVGARLANRQAIETRRLQFIDQQVREFYAPLVGIRREIRGLSEYREEYRKVADETWSELIERYEKNPDRLMRVLESHKEDGFMAYIEYDNSMLANHLLPMYRKMQEIFRDSTA